MNITISKNRFKQTSSMGSKAVVFIWGRGMDIQTILKFCFKISQYLQRESDQT